MDSPKKNLVLTASSDSKILEMASKALLEENLDPILCSDGTEVMESIEILKTKNNLPKLVILESFPSRGEFDMADRLTKIIPGWEAPILMLIGRGEGQKKTNLGVRFGADDYLEKPFEPSELRQKIHSMIKHFRAHAAPHPLTGLDGHPQLEEEILKRLSGGKSFNALWTDINYFRPFNDHYGREKGNEVIRTILKLIQNAVQSEQIPEQQKTFLAHVDGDDFIVLAAEELSEKIRKNLKEKFSAEILRFYSEEERQKGFFIGKDRDQKERIFPLMNLSTAILNVDPGKFSHYGNLVSEANEKLYQAKIGAQDK